MNTSERCKLLLNDIRLSCIKDFDIEPEKYHLEKVCGPGGYVTKGRALFDWYIFFNNPTNKNETVWMSLTGNRLTCDYWDEVTVRFCVTTSSRRRNMTHRDEILIHGCLMDVLHKVEYHFRKHIQEYIREID